MNKYISYSIICLISTFSFMACDVMNTAPSESYSEALVFSSKSTADAFVLGTYGSTVGLYTSNVRMESYSPNGTHNDLTNLDGFPTETGITSSTDQAGFNRFGAIRACNMIIEKCQASTSLSETEKTQLVAEGHFLRGLIFFYQARWMGRFVPITKVLSADDTEAFKTPLTASVAESYKYVIDDFKAAAAGMPETSSPGRANKYAAYAFLSRAALQAYAYTKDNTYLELVKTASEAVINSGKYSLSANFGNMFFAAGNKDAEIILARYYLSDNSQCASFDEIQQTVPNCGNNEVLKSGGSPEISTTIRSFEAWGTFFPTQDLVDQYLVIDQNDGMAKNWDETSQFKNSVDMLNPTSIQKGALYKGTGVGYETRFVPEQEDLGSNSKGQIITKYGKVKDGSRINELMYNNRDKRFYATIVYDSCYWLRNELVTLCCHGNIWSGVRSGQSDSWYTTSSGYYWRKGVYDVSPHVYANVNTDYHFVVARLGEMYLNLAEYYLLKQDYANAVKNLNMTRVAHGGLPAATVSTAQTAWNDYMRERRADLAKEADTYWSFLRWGKYGGYANEGAAAGSVIKALDTPVHKIQISKDRKQFFIGQIWRSGAWNRNFTVKRYLMPIPQGQIDKRAASGITDSQNEGW